MTKLVLAGKDALPLKPPPPEPPEPPPGGVGWAKMFAASNVNAMVTIFRLIFFIIDSFFLVRLKPHFSKINSAPKKTRSGKIDSGFGLFQAHQKKARMPLCMCSCF